ncbi:MULTISPECIES: hypothetical protein [unclassified Thermosipho (in: thermotogales)]|uniref:hypothetical protein n=1 Tax=unclassified Thermosipho (in: thermotogales) TaxID=2676525 RepID=UPI000986CCC6|nr:MULTISPECIES: hypothetical protein [unclassified Thermosipho (in: thermotogales)]MBT1248473.1 hypothetical protein [Thermosipho sp. 1244]OOC47244.1 hypothetical protein XO09_02290 [Thermosipho sp. 1223]
MRRRRRNSVGIWITLLIVFVLLAIFGFFFWKVFTVKNSPEFSGEPKTQYLFIDKENSEGYYIVVDKTMRMVNIIKIKNHMYHPEFNKEINFSSPVLSLEILKDMFNTNAVYSYYAILESGRVLELSKKYGFNSTNFGEFLQSMTSRGLKLFDYFTLDSVMKIFRPETTLTKPAVAKLFDALGKFSVRIRELPTITKSSIKIKVGDKTLERLYIDLEKLNQLKNEIGG